MLMNTTKEACNALTLDFIIKASGGKIATVENDIRQDLANIGIEVITRPLEPTAFDDAEKNGDFNLLFTTTWGAPYDPHSYLTSWSQPAHAEYAASAGLEPPLTRDHLLTKIANVQTQSNRAARQAEWRDILNDIHQQAMFLPLWGSRIPYVFNRRLGGFTPSPQAFSFPLDSVRVLSGSTMVTIAPGNGGLFKSVGPLHPHHYSPNQLFAQAWIYEGLVSYGQDGVIAPALATSWETQDLETGGQRITFQLRQGVKFHDGTDFNCTVAKLNFDHVLSDTVKQRHTWYGTPQQLQSWTCNSDEDFVLETKDKFYPLLQELTYIRPLVFASAASFAQGLDSHPDLHNSCSPGGFGNSYAHLEENITCADLVAPIGTGPFRYVDRETQGEVEAKVTFVRHQDYWGALPEIETLELRHFATTDDVKAALLAGELDMALGNGPLSPDQTKDLALFHSETVDVRHSEVLQHALLVINTGKAPTNDIAVRQAIIHAIDKARFIESEFAGLDQPVAQLLPYTAPYCDVDLSPKWAYDLEKAELLNCPLAGQSSDDLSGGAIAGIAIATVVFLGLAGMLVRMIVAEKRGKPVFAPTDQAEAA